MKFDESVCFCKFTVTQMMNLGNHNTAMLVYLQGQSKFVTCNLLQSKFVATAMQSVSFRFRAICKISMCIYTANLSCTTSREGIAQTFIKL